VEAAVSRMKKKSKEVEMHHLIYLVFIGLGVAWIASFLAPRLPEIGPVITASTWKILLVTTLGILLSLTPARRIPGSHAVAMAIVYIFVASMGAQAASSVLLARGFSVSMCTRRPSLQPPTSEVRRRRRLLRPIIGRR
jgi:uncharacterized membrane protein